MDNLRYYDYDKTMEGLTSAMLANDAMIVERGLKIESRCHL
jgi:hypothetical protein